MEEQAGFQSGRSTIDHIFNIQQLIEKRTAWGKPLHNLFFDLEKVYVTVFHKIIMGDFKIFQF